jgi:hypothetical protein
MNVGDHFVQGRRCWIRLQEKGSKEHEAPCVSRLEPYLDEYIAAAGIADDRTVHGTPHRLTQQDGYWMIACRAREAGIEAQYARDRRHRLPQGGRHFGACTKYGCSLLTTHNEAL